MAKKTPTKLVGLSTNFGHAEDFLMIIFLNGTSSVGKTSIARELMKQSSIPFLYHSSDHILNFWLDSKFVATINDNNDIEKCPLKDWFVRTQSVGPNGQIVTKIANGALGTRLSLDITESVCYLIKKNYDFILDEVVINQEKWNIYKQVLLNLDTSNEKKVFYIEVTCNMEVCEQREKARGDRALGLSRGILSELYHFRTYDLSIDTTSKSSKECAKDILDFISNYKHS